MIYIWCRIRRSSRASQEHNPYSSERLAHIELETYSALRQRDPTRKYTTHSAVSYMILRSIRPVFFLRISDIVHENDIFNCHSGVVSKYRSALFWIFVQYLSGTKSPRLLCSMWKCRRSTEKPEYCSIYFKRLKVPSE